LAIALIFFVFWGGGGFTGKYFPGSEQQTTLKILAEL
jgi:hypothetical protein